jgi:hypothetical protein
VKLIGVGAVVVVGITGGAEVGTVVGSGVGIAVGIGVGFVVGVGVVVGEFEIGIRATSWDTVAVFDAWEIVAVLLPVSAWVFNTLSAMYEVVDVDETLQLVAIPVGAVIVATEFVAPKNNNVSFGVVVLTDVAIIDVPVPVFPLIASTGVVVLTPEKSAIPPDIASYVLNDQV